MTTTRYWWLIYGACALLVLAVLVGISASVLTLERSERRAQLDAEFQESLRLAMWRMDSWLTPYLARESARQHDDYQAYVPQPLAIKVDTLTAEEVLVPSPLLSFRSQIFALHFQIDELTGLTSPQLPAGRYATVADPVDPATQARHQAMDRLHALLDREHLLERLRRAEDHLAPELKANAAASYADEIAGSVPLKQQLKNKAEFDARASCAVDSAFPDQDAHLARVGPLLPLWIQDDGAKGDAVLVLARRARLERSDAIQGVLVDWPVLRQRLTGQIADLFPGAQLAPILDADAAAGLGHDMAMLPVRLTSIDAPDLAVPAITTTRATLGLGWLTTLIALGAVGLTLQRSIEFGARRDRFVSAMTHEMRTPLTTFRMYSGMLADGMIEDEAQRRSYLQTLREEAARLSAMVENVLAFAQLERNGTGSQRRRQTVEELLEHVLPPLQRRAAEAGMTLAIRNEAGDRAVRVDAEPIGQILSSLVDNACKYARESANPTIHLDARADDGALRIRVRDHGPGVPHKSERNIFAPFERGGRDAADEIPGTGLGLAIARGLARQLGGDLTLEPATGGGASFLLELNA